MSSLPSIGRKPLDLSTFYRSQPREPAHTAQTTAKQPARVDPFRNDTFTPSGGRTPGRDTAHRLDPTHNYLRDRAGTHCNQYTQDYLRARGVPANARPTGVANQMNRFLHSPAGARAGWHQVSAAEAQRHVNGGGVGMASWYNNTPRAGRPDGRAPGHVTPIVEGNLTNGSPTVSNAGGHNFERGPASRAFGRHQPEYWVRG